MAGVHRATGGPSHEEGRDGGSMEGPWGRDGGSTYHRSLHRISTIDSTARHLDGDAGVGVDVDGT